MFSFFGRSETLARPNRLLLEKLEDRLLFDGVPDAPVEVQEPEPQSVQSADVGAVEQGGSLEAGAESVAAATATHELVVVDTSVENYQQLLDELLQDAGPDQLLEVALLDSTGDGVQQLTDLLQGRSGLDAIHLVVPSDGNGFRLGNQLVTSDSLAGQAGAIAQWGSALTSTGDLLVYGSHLTETAAGQELIAGLSALAGVDVATSVVPASNPAPLPQHDEALTGVSATESPVGFGPSEPSTGLVADGQFWLARPHEVALLDRLQMRFEWLAARAEAIQAGDATGNLDAIERRMDRLEQRIERLTHGTVTAGSMSPESGDAAPLVLGGPSLLDTVLLDTVPNSAPVDAAQPPAVADVRHELVVIDTSVEDHQALLADLQAQAGPDRQFEIVLVDSTTDGVAQLTELLAGRTDLDAIHFISHGSNGAFRLGNQWITNDSLPGLSEQIAHWGASLTEDGDILIYGCDAAALTDGQSLMNSLAALTGADVAASTNQTGTAALGGDWNLEYRTGAIETATQLQDGAADQWQGLLAAPTIAAAHTSTFYIDSGAGLQGRYIAYTITNPNATPMSDVQVSIGTFTGGVVTKATNEDGVVHLGTLAAGASATAYFYVQASSVTAVPQNHTINVYSGPPGFSAPLATQVFTLTTVETTIAASANKVTTVVSGPNPASLGGLMTMTVTGDTGVIGAAKVLSYTPASFPTWDANAYELLSSSIVLSGNANAGTFDNTLVIPPGAITTTADTHYVATYTFRAMAVTTAPTTVSPVGYFSSGAQVKHTSTGGYAAFAPIASATNTVTLSLGVNQVNWPSTGGEATYTLTLTNTGTSAVTLDQLNVALASSPANLTYVAGTSTYGGSAISNPFISGQNLTWSGSFTVAAGSTTTLVFHATAPATAGTYTTTATGKIGSTVIDTTLSTTDNAPASTFVNVNARPTTANQTLTMNENGTLVFSTSNFPYVDTDGDAQQSVKITSLPGAGTLTLNGVAVTANQVISVANIAAGLLTYQPVANQFASPYTSFGFQVGDAIEFSTTATMTINVLEFTNNPPVDGNETNTVTEDVTLTVADGAAGDLLNNATDVDGNPLTISAFTVAGQAGPFTVGTPYAIAGVGTLTLNANGSYSFAPAANYTGAIPVVTYTVSDGNGGTDTSTLTLSITAVNDPPVDGNETNTVTEDVTLTVADGAAGDLLNNATDLDGLALTISAFTVAGESGSFVVGTPYAIAGVGTLTLNANGSYSFAPTANYTGAIPVVTYTVSDGNGGTDTSTLTLSITAVNDPPVAVDDTFTTNEDTAVSVAVKTNDSDVEGNPLTVTQVNGTAIVAGGAAIAVTNGTVSLNAAGTLLTFTPTANYNGPASFTYTISDGAGGTASATVSGTVMAVNDPPVAVNDSSGTINEDTSASVTVKTNDSDVDGNPLTITQVNGAAITAGGAAVAVTNGSVTLSADGTTLTFSPSANYNGPASYTYTISDGAGGTASATVSGTVTAVNDAPVNTLPASYTTNEDTSLVLSGLSISDVDAASGNMTVTLSVTNGTLTANTGVSGGVPLAGIVGNGSGSVVLTGTLAQINATLAHATGMTFNPSANFNGNVTLTMLTSDLGNTGTGGTLTDSDTRTITVNAVNDPPVAGNDSFTTNEDTAVTTTVLTNDSDLDGNPLSITQVNGAAIVAGGVAIAVTNGTVSLNAAGTQLTFTPSANYNGAASYTYTISDGQGGTATATVNGTVTAVNDPPVAVNDSFTTNEDTAVSVAVKTNDSDVDGNPLTITQVNGAAIVAGGAAIAVTNGTVSLNAAGTLLTFTPTANYNGPASFTYTISDGAGGTAAATVNGTVMAVNDPPVAVNDSFTTNEDTAVTITALTNDTDLDGNPLSITQINGAAIIAGGAAVAVTNGTVSLNAAGTQLTFTPSANYNGAASFTYTISDGAGGTASATISGTVNAVYDPPVAVNDTFSTTEDTAVAISVKANDSDVDGNPLTITQVNGAAITAGGAAVAVTNGTVSLNAAGTQLIFTPTTNYNGPASFTYTISDGAGGTATATVSGSVGAVNDPPAAVADTNTTTENTNASGNVLTNDSDLDLDPLTVSAVNGAFGNVGSSVTGSNGGAFHIGSTGAYTFNPGAAFDDLAVGQSRATSVTYEVSDGNGGTATTTVTVTVTGTNDAPTSTALAPQNNTDSQVVTLDVSASFSDPDGSDTFTFTSAGLPPGLSIHPTTGVITGTIAANASVTGPYSVTITGTDPSGAATSQTFTWNVANPAPTATDDSGSTTENATATGNVLTDGADDTDPDGDTLAVSAVNGVAGNVGTSVTGSNGGSFTINANGGYSFNPGTAFDDLAVGETRVTTVSYTLSDGQGGTDTAVVTMTVTGTNDAPTSTPIATQNNPDSTNVTLNVSGSFSDPDASTALTFSATNLPPGLSIHPTTGVITGTMASNASATGPYSVTITGTDPSGAATSQSFTWTVTNPAPTANADSGTTTENASTGGNVRTNDTDPDGDALVVSAVNGVAGNVGSSITGSSGGAFNIGATGAYTFAPGAAFEDLALGETRVTTVSYTISDGQGGTSAATLSVTVTGTNDAPTSTAIAAQSDNDSEIVSLDVSGSFADADGSDTFTFNASNLPPGLSINPTTGVITGTIAANASVGGPYSVTIMGTDPNGAATTQTFTWTVTNPAPTANADTNSTTENVTTTGNVITNDTDPDGDTLTVGAVNGVAGNIGASVTGSSGGSFTVNTNGGYTFNPGAAFDDLAVGETRTTSVAYTATDSQGGTSTTTLTITVTGTNDAPTSTPIATQNNSDSAVVSLNVSGSFSDPDASDTFTFTATNLPPGLSIDQATGLISGTIDHSASVGGPYSVTITGTDPHGSPMSQTFTWNVTNPGPNAVANTGTAEENGSTSGNVLTNDSDPDGDTLTVSEVNGVAGNIGTSVTGSNGGSFNIGSTGAYTFNPGTAFDDLALGETRTTTVSYTASDNEGGTSTTTLTITVTGTNDGPVSTVIADQAHTDSAVVNVNISGSFSDLDASDVLTFAASNLPPGLSLDANTGLISGTLASNASAGGPYSVTITATDPNGAITTQTFNWVVTNVPPTAYDDFDGTTENSLVAGNVLANDIDPDNDPLVVGAVNGVAGNVGASLAGSNGGFFTINSNGSYTFIPDTDFDDLAAGETRSTTIRYTADDNNGGAVEATLTVIVTGVNDSPSSTPIGTQVSNDSAVVTLDVSSHFSDPDASDTFTFTATGLPTGLSIDPTTGVITGTIASNASVSGPFSVTITGTDPSNVATSRSFTWNVLNPAPTAVDDTNSTTENATTSGNVIPNDSDPDGDALAVSAVNGAAGNVGSSVTGSSGGSFTINSNGTYSFNPGTAFDDLAVGETRTTSVTYTVTDNEGGSSTATVLVTVTGTNDAPVVTTPIPTQDSTGLDVVSLDISVSFADPDGTDVLTYTATNLPPGLTLDPQTGVITGTIDPDAAAGGPYSVTITATDPNGTPVSQTFTWNVVNPDLVVTVGDDDITVQPDGTIVYTLNYVNDSDRAATGVVLTQALPPYTTFDAAQSSPGWIDNGDGTFSYQLGHLAAHDAGSLLFAVVVDATLPTGVDDTRLAPQIADDGTHGVDPTPANNRDTEVTPIDAAPDLRVDLTAPTSEIVPGATLSYTLDYTNVGNQEGTGVVLTMQLPPHTTFVPGTSSPGWVDRGHGRFTFDVGSLPSGEGGKLTFNVVVDSVLPPGVDDLRASVTATDDQTNGADQNPTDNRDGVTTLADAEPDYRVTIGADADTVFRQQDIAYTLTVVNAGNQDGTGVVVTNHFSPEVLANVQASHGGVIDMVAGTITWNLGDLPVGEPVVLTVTAHIPLGVPASVVGFSHHTSVSDDLRNGADPTPANNVAGVETKLQGLNYDHFNSAKDSHFGFFQSVPPLTTKLMPISVDPIFSGITEPGATLVGKIYDEDGNLIGERQVMADTSGNWLMTFPGSVVMENPHHMEIRQTAAIHNLSHENGYNLRRYFHPAAVSSIFFTEDYSVSSVFRRSAYEMIESSHEGNLNPYGFAWFAHAYELTAASTNAGQG